MAGGDGVTHRSVRKENTHMLMTIAIVLLVLYALGLVTSFTAGGLIHLLLVAAVVVVLVRLIQGRSVV
jgi:Ca2+/Na+ antiporter